MVTIYFWSTIVVQTWYIFGSPTVVVSCHLLILKLFCTRIIRVRFRSLNLHFYILESYCLPCVFTLGQHSDSNLNASSKLVLWWDRWSLRIFTVPIQIFLNSSFVNLPASSPKGENSWAGNNLHSPSVDPTWSNTWSTLDLFYNHFGTDMDFIRYTDHAIVNTHENFFVVESLQSLHIHKWLVKQTPNPYSESNISEYDLH